MTAQDFHYPSPRRDREENASPQPSLLLTLMIFMHYGTLLLFAYLRDFMRKIGLEKTHNAHELPKMQDFVPLYSDFESLYTRNFYIRIRDCWNRPISSVPGCKMSIIDWTTPDYGWTFKFTGKTTEVKNFGSYNYLGFAQNSGPCADDSVGVIQKFGVGNCSPRAEVGTLTLHKQLDEAMAEFLGVEAALCFPMGFATNSMNLSCFIGRGCLILSDELNHASIVLGCRLSGATIKVFKHNDVKDLERHLKNAVIYGQPRTKRPYKKILICVEGIYSMEGTIVKLPEILALKKKFKAYLFVDEAHSIGAIGDRGRGICDYHGIDHREIDILMGTFTKSFASVGGYMAGKRSLVNHLLVHSHATTYAASLSAPCVQQILTSLAIIRGVDQRDNGPHRIETLARNSRYFRAKLNALGFTIFGDHDSPVVPLLMYFMSRITYASRAMIPKKLGVVVVGFPATPISLARARFCLSASHTKKDLDEALAVMDELGAVLNIRKNGRRSEKRAREIEY